MNWDHLRVFVAVARYGQILSAARNLKLDHATVSRRLTTLEGELGAKLVDRTPLGCVLTPAGRGLFQTAERMESETLRIQSALGDSDEPVSGVVRIGTPDGFGIYFLTPQLGVLVERHPELTIRLVPLPKIFSVYKREVDVAITDRPEDGQLICQKSSTIACACTPARPIWRPIHAAQPGRFAGAYAGDNIVRHPVESDDRFLRRPDDPLALPFRVRQPSGPVRGAEMRDRRRYPSIRILKASSGRNQSRQ